MSAHRIRYRAGRLCPTNRREVWRNVAGVALIVLGLLLVAVVLSGVLSAQSAATNAALGGHP